MADQLCTLANVKARLKITDVTDDAMLGRFIDEVSDWIQDYTGRKLVPENAATYVVDTAPGYRIGVRRGIRAVTSLGLATTDQPDSGGSYTAVDLADVLLRPPAIDRRPGSPATEIWIRGQVGRLVAAINGARIVGDFGWAATPERVVAVAEDAVVNAYTVRKSGTSGAVGADDSQVIPWAQFFGRGTPQRGTLDRLRGVGGIG